jgi:ABC-type sugar transport system substrate-binding protein
MQRKIASKFMFRSSISVIAALACASVARADDFTLGFSAGFLTDPFQAVLVQKSLAAAEADGITTLPAANANGDAGKQIADVQNLMAAGAQALLLNPTDSQAIIPALAAASENSIPVVTIDAAPAGGKVAMIVRADNKRMGEEACEAIGKALDGQGIVLSLLGDQATTNGRDRTTGFNECIKAKFSDIKVIEQPTNWKADRASAAAQTVINSTPELSAIYIQSDSVMLAGVLNVLKSAGRDVPAGEKGHIFLASIDGTPFALSQIREGRLDVAISQPLDLYVKYGVQYVKDAMAKKTFQAGKTDHDSEIVMLGDNPMDLLPAPVVTKQNVDDTSLWGNAGR